MEKIRLKRWLALMGILLLSGCSHSPRGQAGTAIALPDPYIATIRVVYSKTALQGEMERFSGGGIRLMVDSPENLSGLTLQLEEGTLRAEYTGLQVSLPHAAAPDSAVLTLLQDALNTINGEKPPLHEKAFSRPLQLENEHGRLEVLLEEENFLPKKITMPDLGFTAELSVSSPKLPE